MIFQWDVQSFSDIFHAKSERTEEKHPSIYAERPYIIAETGLIFYRHAIRKQNVKYKTNLGCYKTKNKNKNKILTRSTVLPTHTWSSDLGVFGGAADVLRCTPAWPAGGVSNDWFGRGFAATGPRRATRGGSSRRHRARLRTARRSAAAAPPLPLHRRRPTRPDPTGTRRPERAAATKTVRDRPLGTRRRERRDRATLERSRIWPPPLFCNFESKPATMISD